MPKNHILESSQINFETVSLIDLKFINKIESELELQLTSIHRFNFIVDNQFSYFWKILFLNKIIGVVQLQGDIIEAEILSIGIKKNFQRLGIGEKTINFLICKGFKNIFLEVSEKNSKAIKFYNSVGFKKIASRKNYYKINKKKPENAQIFNLKII